MGLSYEFFQASGPNEIVLDLERRTYRELFGWRWSRHVQIGAIDDDIAGIYVRCVQKDARYDVGLVWKNSKESEQKWRRLGSFTGPSEADQFAAETIAALHLPLVPPPPALRSSLEEHSAGEAAPEEET